MKLLPLAILAAALLPSCAQLKRITPSQKERIKSAITEGVRVGVKAGVEEYKNTQPVTEPAEEPALPQ